MPERAIRDPYAVLFLIPSFYGALTWGVWLLLYLLQLIRLDSVSLPALAVFAAMELLFILSACIWYPFFRVLDRDGAADAAQCLRSPGRRLLAMLHLVGFGGLLLYVHDTANFFGGMNAFWYALLHNAASIRGEVELPISFGTQLSYFGWLAIAFTLLGVANHTVSKRWLFPVVMQFVGNLVYIDRTRPVWILFTSLLVLMVARGLPSITRIVRWATVTAAVFLVLFWVVAEWTGKSYYEDKFEDAAIPGNSQVLYAYGVSGFAYFNHMLTTNEPVSHSTGRVLYPLRKVLAKLGLMEEPPSQVLEFFDIPFETNVGTFLEPFYRDGGFLFILFGALAYSFGLDLMAVRLLSSRDPFALFAWANVCFTSFIAFFTPKLTQFPIWLFCGLALVSLLLRQFRMTLAWGGRQCG